MTVALSFLFALSVGALGPSGLLISELVGAIAYSKRDESDHFSVHPNTQSSSDRQEGLSSEGKMCHRREQGNSCH